MKRNTLFTLLAALLLAVVAVAFFAPDVFEGRVLQQADIQQGIANGEEARAFHEATGQTTRWTDSLFGGMPTFQIAPSYPAGSLLDWIWKVYTLGLPSPANLLFAMMLGFFIMCLCMKMRWPMALFGAIAWGFSTYFIIIIGAGHIWKFVTLAYIPPTIGGIVLAYRGKWLGGGAMAALFGALQLQSNHPQMTYYFGFVIAAMMLAWLIDAVRKHEMRRWIIATLTCIVAGSLAVGANAPSLYNSYEYSKETERGRATLLATEGAPQAQGLSVEKITGWSYGVDETLTLLIPNVKGGASLKPVAAVNQALTVADTPEAERMANDGEISPEVLRFMTQFGQYFGNQPMTNGPVYVGAFILLLAVLAMFVVRGAMKWCLFGVALLAILLSWGHNFMPFTEFFINHFPAYNKFRTVSSILVIVEFVVPLLALMCVGEMVRQDDFYKRYKWTFQTVFGLGATICLLGWVAPGIFGQAFSASEMEQLNAMGAWSTPEIAAALRSVAQARQVMVSADCLRSLIFIVLGWGVMMLWFRRTIKSETLFVCLLAAVALIDLFPLNKRYVDTDNFTDENMAETTFEPTVADRAILADKGHYRVFDVADFGGARSSYFHKTVGGYHAAKLTRYNDLINSQISKGTPGVINMLNAKYILNGDKYEVNPDANGSAWLVDRVDFVGSTNAEMAALDTLPTRRAAVALEEMRPVLGQATPVEPGDTLMLTSYAPNKLTYNYKSARGGIGVFSEIWFPWGWTATVGGRETEIGRVDYVLRALRLPAGSGEIVFTFDPQSVRVANTMAYTSIIVIYILCIAALTAMWIAWRRRKGAPADK